MRRIVKAALTETCSVADASADFETIRKANVDHHIELMEQAHREGVQVVCFGELFTAPYFALGKDAKWIPMAEPAQDGPTCRQLSEAAKRLKMAVIAPIYEKDGEDRFNTALILDENGVYQGRYRKSHIPYGSNEQGEFAENFYYGRSNTDPLFPTFKLSFGTIGVAICYDRHFFYAVQQLAANGAELVFSPAITFGAKSERMWEMEFEVDAARYNVFIGGSNRRGVEPPWTQPYFGRSYFVGPNGRLANQSSHNNLIVADVDLTTLSEPDPSGWNLPRDSRHTEVWK